jgi:hypothetical protein
MTSTELLVGVLRLILLICLLVLYLTEYFDLPFVREAGGRNA